MIRIGLGYSFEKEVIEHYAKDGLEYVASDAFWEEYQIGVNQFKYNIKYLYGLLLSATRKWCNSFLIHHKKDKNGLAVWLKFEKSYGNKSFKAMKSENLEDKIYASYEPTEHNGIADYIDKFQTWIAELDALQTSHYKDED